VELFCQTIYQNGSSSTDRAVHGAEAQLYRYFKELYMWSCFAKRFTKTAPALQIELFMELKQKKNGFTGKVEPCQTGGERRRKRCNTVGAKVLA
jgi:hypothetical protein